MHLMKKFVCSLNKEEFEFLARAVNERKTREEKDRFEKNCRFGKFPELSEMEKEYIKKENKIEAIKLYRERNGCSLTEAKDFIDKCIEG